jgi:D-sedoheptulose 7-phosphate isomerase
MTNYIDSHLRAHTELMDRILRDHDLWERVDAVSWAIIRAYRNGRCLFLFGCGGSAADAQHIAAEFVNRYRLPRAGLPAIALTTDSSILTAVGNDDSFENVFSRQVEALVREGDVVMGISTSGRSPSVLRGLAVAKARGAISVLLTGEQVREIPDVTDHVINVPSRSTPLVQEAHSMIAHIICGSVEEELSHGSPGGETQKD